MKQCWKEQLDARSESLTLHEDTQNTQRDDAPKIRDPLKSTGILGGWYDGDGTTALAVCCHL